VLIVTLLAVAIYISLNVVVTVAIRAVAIELDYCSDDSSITGSSNIACLL